MTTKSKWTAVRYIVEGIIAFALVVYVVMRYETQILAINWRLVALACIAAAAVFGMYRWQMREDNTYDVMHMLMKDGRADLYAHITIASFGLAVWLVVQQALADKDVAELMLGVLGIFVAGKAAGGFSDAMSKRGPPVDKSRDINIMPDASVQVSQKPLIATGGGGGGTAHVEHHLSPKIKPEHVGASVALVKPKRKPTTKKGR